MLCSCSCIHRAPEARVTATEVSPDSPPRPPGVVSGIAPRCVSGPHLQNSHVISLGQFLISPTNVAIPTMPIQCLNGLHGNYVRNCWAHTRRHWRGGWPRAPGRKRLRLDRLAGPSPPQPRLPRRISGPYPARARPRLRFQPQCAQTVDHLAQNTPKMPISTEVDCTLSTNHKSRT